MTPSGKGLVWSVYILQIGGCILFFMPWVAVVLWCIGFGIDIFSRGEHDADPLAKAHFSWQFRTFLIGFVLTLFGVATTWFLGLGLLILLLTLLYMVWRAAKGAWRFNKEQMV